MSEFKSVIVQFQESLKDFLTTGQVLLDNFEGSLITILSITFLQLLHKLVISLVSFNVNYNSNSVGY